MASSMPARTRDDTSRFATLWSGTEAGCLSYVRVTTTVTSAECVMEPIVAVTVTV